MTITQNNSTKVKNITTTKEGRKEYMRQYYLQKKALEPPKPPKPPTIKKTEDMKAYKLAYNRALLLKKNGVIKPKGRPRSIDDMKVYKRNYMREHMRRKRKLETDNEELIKSITILTTDVFKDLVIE